MDHFNTNGLKTWSPKVECLLTLWEHLGFEAKGKSSVWHHHFGTIQFQSSVQLLFLAVVLCCQPVNTTILWKQDDANVGKLTERCFVYTDLSLRNEAAAGRIS